MPRITARSIVTRALRLLRVHSPSQPLDATMAADGLEALNALLSSLANDRLLVWERPEIVHDLTPGQGEYTWGVPFPGFAPDIGGEPPLRLEICLLRVLYAAPTDWPLSVVDQNTWAEAISQKTFSSGYPEVVFLDRLLEYAVLHTWPVPTVANALVLYPWEPAPTYARLDTARDWPRGYERLLAYTLAVEVAPEYGVDPTADVRRIAEESRLLVHPVNATVGRLRRAPGRGAPSANARLVRFLSGT